MFKLVEIDETSHYQIDPEDRRLIYQITTVYLYDSSVQTFACTAEGAFEMHPLYVNVYVEDGLREDVVDDLQSRYGEDAGEVCYMTAYRVEATEGQVEVGELKEVQTIDDLIEFYRGNHML